MTTLLSNSESQAYENKGKGVWGLQRQIILMKDVLIALYQYWWWFEKLNKWK